MLQGRQVEAFRAVMLTGSMTGAAEMLHVTQPAVSRLIRDLELALKLKLFYRSGNNISPTAEASDFLAEVERSFIGLDRLRERAENLRSGRSGSLAIAALPAMATAFLPRFVADFCQKRPNIKIVIDGIPSHLVLEYVENGQFDIGLTALAVDRPSLHATRIRAKAVVAIPLGHRLEAKKAIRAADLEDERLIKLSSRYGHHATEMTLQNIDLALRNIRRRYTIETPLSYVACGLVAEGMGLAIVDPYSASDFIDRGVVLRPFEPACAIDYSMIRPSIRPPSIVAQEFSAALLEHIRGFLDRQDYLSDRSARKPRSRVR